ncbi:CBS domain-containing protein [Aurantiacibacter spongiae]|uniref:CBS domain-containing protein n=1 Tax=Aurantiacibacter spongiae TaxID=2488860 RepID=A0A3N5D9U6_9SPHN|nr:CBS domain-containing protein [Aurantiacibacter spongiae]RPF71408.1 CBS domain-containing protein [Aurantiacibacter spongiae]
MSIAQIIEGREDRTIISCTPRDTVAVAASLLAEKRIGALPVLDGKGVAGIFSERDLLYCVAREGAEVLSRAVGEVMTSPAITIDTKADALTALSLMTRRRIRHLPVCDGDRLIGFVSIGDLVKYRMDRIEHEADQMREYIRTA